MEEHWVLFSKKGCPHCLNAENTLYNRINQNISMIINIIPSEKYHSYKEEFSTNMSTWPRLFLIENCNNECNKSKRILCKGDCKNRLIGGNQDLQNYLKNKLLN
jgi:glutaredoxin